MGLGSAALGEEDIRQLVLGAIEFQLGVPLPVRLNEMYFHIKCLTNFGLEILGQYGMTNALVRRFGNNPP